jgi:hypothetical protein
MSAVGNGLNSKWPRCKRAISEAGQEQTTFRGPAQERREEE